MKSITHRKDNIMEIAIIGLVRFGIALVVFFIFTLAVLSARLVKENYNFVMSLIIVIVSFGSELLITFYPTHFPQSEFHDVLVDILGGIAALTIAELFYHWRRESTRHEVLADTIHERYRRLSIYDPLSWRY